MTLSERKIAAAVLLALAAAWAATAAMAADDAGKPDKKEAGKSDPAGVPLELRVKAKKAAYVLDRGGKSAKEYREEIEAALKSGPVPTPPAVDLVLELKNTGKRDLQVRIGGDETESTLVLKGPGVVSSTREYALGRRSIPAKVITLAAGKSHEIPLKTLTAGTSNLKVQRTYWTEAGKFTLTATYRTAVSPAPEGAKDAGRGFGAVKLTSAPVMLTVKDKE
jgi:hypothetical protein